MLVKATPENLDQFVELARLFVEESGYAADGFDAHQSRDTLELSMNHGLVIGWEVDGVIVGGASVDFGCLWTKRKWAFLNAFYVRRESRRSEAGAQLVCELLRFCADADIARVFASSTGNISPVITRQFINLFRRVGFTELGPVLMWEKKPNE